MRASSAARRTIDSKLQRLGFRRTREENREARPASQRIFLLLALPVYVLQCRRSRVGGSTRKVTPYFRPSLVGDLSRRYKERQNIAFVGKKKMKFSFEAFPSRADSPFWSVTTPPCSVSPNTAIYPPASSAGAKSQGQAQLPNVRSPGVRPVLQPPQAIAENGRFGGVEGLRPLLLRRGSVQGCVSNYLHDRPLSLGLRKRT